MLPVSLLEKLGLVRSKPEAHAKTARSYTISNPYHAVSVVMPLAGACQAAAQCAGKRFLSAEAPKIPMKGCDSPVCRCRYQHHDDRRVGPRRTSDATIRTHSLAVWSGSEKREGRGRRITDH